MLPVPLAGVPRRRRASVSDRRKMHAENAAAVNGVVQGNFPIENAIIHCSDAVMVEYCTGPSVGFGGGDDLAKVRIS